MKIQKAGLILASILSTQSLGFFASDAWAESTGKLEEQFMKRIKSSKLAAKDFGVYIADDEGKAILSVNAGSLMIPASITKLATAATFLDKYQPGTKFKTQLVSSAKNEGGRLNGDLYLRGGGDPSFVSESMWFLVNSFVRSGIKTIDGDLVVDDTLFDAERFDASRMSSRVDRAYDAPTGAMSFNWNSVNVFVRPANKAGEPATVWIDPENEYIKLVGSVQTVSSTKTLNVSIEREDDTKRSADIIRISGQIGAGQPEYVQFKNITRPDIWSGYNLKAFLAERGITVKGSVRAGPTPTGTLILAEVESKAMESMVSDMNKFSNNYVAEMLAKHLGLTRKQPGTVADGMIVIQDYLKEIGIGPNEMILGNPSGLTRDNKATAKGMWKLLNHIADDFQTFPEFATSLPIAGVDGTLKKRMKSRGERQVRAKTGLLTGVVALAGFAGRKSGKATPFVFIYNGNADGSVVRSTVDQVVEDLVQLAP